jgi:segregation and condensation protein B
MEIRLEKEAALIETVLFLESDPMDEAALARATGLGVEVVEKALEQLAETFRENVHGLEPIRSGGGWILAPKLELWESLKDRYGKKADSRLSRAALETLSIVAYSQPITRPEIEAIRGVSADGMIRFLLERGLIKEMGKKDAPGRPVQYGTTKEFLKYFRLGSIADLPKLDDLERERFDEEELEGEGGGPPSLKTAPVPEAGQAPAGAGLPTQAADAAAVQEAKDDGQGDGQAG